MFRTALVALAVLLTLGLAIVLAKCDSEESKVATSEITPARSEPESSRPSQAFPVPPMNSRPGEVGADILKQYYPVGQVRMTALTGQLEGFAANQAWGYRGSYYVVADAEHRVKWEVLENDGRRIRFRVHVPVSNATLLASERRFSVRLPEMPLLVSVLLNVFQADPSVRGSLMTAQKVWELIQVADPNLERTATALTRFLESRGLKKSDVEELDLKIRQMADDVQGVTATLVYEDGFGITERLELDGVPTDRQDLIHRVDMQLRRMNPVLAAYFLYPLQTPPGATAIDTSVGAEWDVDAAHIAGLFSAAIQQDVEGTMRVRRRADAGDEVVLEVVRADIRYVATESRKATAVELHVRPGTAIHLVPDDGGYRVDRGRIEGKASVNRHSIDHWLFEEQFQAEPNVRLQFHQFTPPTP